MTFGATQRVLFLTLAGSQAHGTARDGSDVDLRGVCVAPLSTRLSLFHQFEQYEGELPEALAEQVLPQLRVHPTARHGIGVKTECTIFDVGKFLSLCAAANPSALEILFADERDWVFETPAWRSLHAQRHVFVTRKVEQTFLGYALAQLKKIKSHRAWLLNPPASKPAREDFGLPAVNATLSRDDQNRIEQSIADALRRYGIDDVQMPKDARVAVLERMAALHRDALGARDEEIESRMRAVASHALSVPTDVIAALNAEKRYRAAMKHWDAYQSWKLQRNPARAELERAHGYDTKHAMHLVRLMRMGREALETGEIFVRRPDADELAAIRAGALSFDALLEEANALQVAMANAASTTSLRDDVDPGLVDALASSLMRSNDA